MSSIAGLYSSRGGLAPGSPVFVGREETLRDIFLRLSGTNKNLPGVAVVGPRRVGKTSLLKQLLSPTVRSRYSDGAKNWHVAYLDLSSRHWSGFGDLRDAIFQALESPRKDNSIRHHECLCEGIQRITRQGGVTTILLMDEFNYIAPELGKEEQAELRAAIDNVPSFSTVLAVFQAPDEILEHIPYDTASELAPVVNLALPGLACLSELEARGLVRVGRSHIGLRPDNAAEDFLISLAGTHPLLIHAACFGWYRVAGSRTYDELSQLERQSAQTSVHEEVSSQWRHVVHSLSGVTRAMVLGQIRPANQDQLARVERELRTLGLPSGLYCPGPLAMGQSATPPAETEAPVDELMKVIEEINARHQLLVGRVEWVFRTDRLGGNDGIYLRRQVRSHDGFNWMVEALARLLYDGSNGVVPPELRGKVKPMLPSWCYKDDRSVITHLLGLRNYHTHLQAPDPQLAAEHLKSAGDVFEKYCGSRAPALADLEATRIGLVIAATRFVSRLNQMLPLSRDLEADQFFSC